MQLDYVMQLDPVYRDYVMQLDLGLLFLPLIGFEPGPGM